MSYSPKRAGSSSKSGSKAGTKASSKSTLSAADQKKKKGLIIAIVSVLVVVILIALVFIFAPSDGSFLGIRGSGVLTGGNGYVPETQDGTTNISPYYQDGILPTAADRHDIHLIEGGGADAGELYGKWELDQATTYMFDGQGRGIMLTGVDNYTFNYSAENGKLGIDFDTINGSDFEYDYTVSGDKLTMTRGSSTFNLTRVDQ